MRLNYRIESGEEGDEMNGYKSAAALADSSMWEEVNGANPPMMVEGDLIWRGAGVCADPVALAQAAVDEIIRLTRERDEARRDLQFYKDREAHYARVLGVDDGGRFRADWDGAIDRLVRRATAAEAKVAYLEPHLDHVCRLHAAAEARVRELEERIVALEAQLTTRGACECGAALARRAQEAEALLAGRAT